MKLSSFWMSYKSASKIPMLCKLAFLPFGCRTGSEARFGFRSAHLSGFFVKGEPWGTRSRKRSSSQVEMKNLSILVFGSRSFFGVTHATYEGHIGLGRNLRRAMDVCPAAPHKEKREEKQVDRKHKQDPSVKISVQNANLTHRRKGSSVSFTVAWWASDLRPKPSSGGPLYDDCESDSSNFSTTAEGLLKSRAAAGSPLPLGHSILNGPIRERREGSFVPRTQDPNAVLAPQANNLLNAGRRLEMVCSINCYCSRDGAPPEKRTTRREIARTPLNNQEIVGGTFCILVARWNVAGYAPWKKFVGRGLI
ncbi:hypothetical protein GEV33_005326 [Tenebrio molitor]|uniref:Uncharacterized protein n=1 Tax=Tenebrio molitor TaxID=7067 RepID=A0A8J6HET5_TENMO|nr:hypothetical protein GEV33_005326 [Tenebrio molitor]